MWGFVRWGYLAFGVQLSAGEDIFRRWRGVVADSKVCRSPDPTAENRIPELSGDQYYIAQRGGGGWSAPLLSAAGREGAPTHPRRAEQRYRRTTRRRGWRACRASQGCRGSRGARQRRENEPPRGAAQGAGQPPRAARRAAHYQRQTQSARRLARRMVCVRLCACG